MESKKRYYDQIRKEKKVAWEKKLSEMNEGEFNEEAYGILRKHLKSRSVVGMMRKADGEMTRMLGKTVEVFLEKLQSDDDELEETLDKGRGEVMEENQRVTYEALKNDQDIIYG